MKALIIELTDLELNHVVGGLTEFSLGDYLHGEVLGALKAGENPGEAVRNYLFKEVVA